MITAEWDLRFQKRLDEEAAQRDRFYLGVVRLLARVNESADDLIGFSEKP